jgi:ribosome-binding ATPase YchF (GTP1/OBG family)
MMKIALIGLPQVGKKTLFSPMPPVRTTASSPPMEAA